MKVDPREILFIRQNCPRGLFTMISENTGIELIKVRNEFFSLKEEYPDEIVIEARRLLKVISNIEYRPELVA